MAEELTPEEIEAQRLLDEAATADGEEGAAELGDAGKQALDRMKAKWQTERDRARDLEAKLTEATAKPAEGDPELAAARQQAVADAVKEATAKANERILRSEIRAAATGKLANPALALKLLDLSEFEVDGDGNVDAEEISDAIAELIKKEPYLAAQGRRFQGDADSGPRNRDTKAGQPPQVTEDQLAKMSPEEIVEARDAGRLADLLGG